jgi:hypothetical protein
MDLGQEQAPRRTQQAKWVPDPNYRGVCSRRRRAAGFVVNRTFLLPLTKTAHLRGGRKSELTGLPLGLEDDEKVRAIGAMDVLAPGA